LNKLLKNSFYGSGSFVIVSLVALVTTPYFVYKLSVEIYGIYILITSLVGYYGLADLGLGQGVVKFVSEYVARGDRKQAARYLNAALLVQFIVGLFITALFSFFAEGLVKLLRVPSCWTSVAIFGMRLCSLGFLFSMISSTLAAALQGLQRYDITSTIETAMNVVLNLTIAGFLFLGFGLREIIIVTTISSVLVLLIYIQVLRVNMKEWNFFLRIKKKEIVEIFGFSSFLFISRASNLFANYVVRYIVAVFAGPAAVTLFVVPSKLIGAIGGVISSGANAVFPYASEIQTVDPSGIKSLFYKGSRIFAAISIPALLFLMIFSRQLLTLWMGEVFANQSWMILSILALSGLIAAQSTVPNLIIAGMGHSKTLGFFGILALGCYSISVPVFTHLLGVLGAALGMLSSGIVGIGFVFYKTSRIVEIDLFSFLFGTFNVHIKPIVGLTGIFSILFLLYGQVPLFLYIGTLMFIGYYAFLFLKVEELTKYTQKIGQCYPFKNC
jgi:O-antigen/teichoic acid export membrane protein